MRRPHLGDQELEVLRFIAEHGPLTVGRATEGFGTPRGLSRSTVKTVMERLHRKGYLSRMQDGGVFHYACQVPQEELVGGLVQQFIEKTLAGSLSPFFAYFAAPGNMSDEELSQLEHLVEKLRIERGD